MDSTVCNYVNGKKECLCLYVGMIHFVYTRNEYNFVNQLYSDKIKFKKKVTPFKKIKINKSFEGGQHVQRQTVIQKQQPSLKEPCSLLV